MAEDSNMTTDMMEGNATTPAINITSKNSRLHCNQLYDHYQPNQFTIPLYGFVAPILLIVTVIANTMVVIVLSQTNMRNASNTILLAISLSDSMTMLVSTPYFFYMYTLSNYKHPLESPLLCYLWTYTTDIIPTLFHTTSIWLTLVLAAQRYVHICRTPIAALWCNKKNVILISIAMLLLSTLHQGARFFENYYVVDRNEDGSMLGCMSCKSKWLHVIGEDIYYHVYFWSRVIVIHLGPCLVLVVLNVLLYRKMQQALLTRRRLMQGSIKNKESRSSHEKHHTTLMLIVIVSIFLVTEFPLAVITLLHILHASQLMDFLYYEKSQCNLYLTYLAT